MPAQDEQTLAFYSRFAATYVTSGHGGITRHLSDFLSLLPERARILELGCGSGRDAQAMIDAGHSVDPTDGCAAIVAEAQRLVTVPVREMRFDELVSEGTYDAIWANASLLHVPRTELSAVLARILRALKPGGLHHATYRAGKAEGRDSHGRYFNHPDGETLIKLYRAAGNWKIVSVSAYVGGGYDKGVAVPWISILAKRPI